jgi:hypothetical protein
MSVAVTCPSCHTHFPSSDTHCPTCGRKVQSPPASAGPPKDKAVTKKPRPAAAPIAQQMSTVFISHSHRDKDFALYVDRILKQNGATTFLDQEQLAPGEELHGELKEGIGRCGVFLLLWSRHAAASGWVNDEWSVAYDRRKKIVPYALDDTPLPDALSNFIYVPADDREHGHVGLLQAVFGKAFRPSATTLFPGKWRMEADAMGMASGWYEFELRPNGQLLGTAGLYLDRGEAGNLLALVTAMGGPPGSMVTELLGHTFPMSGTWSYDDRERTLMIDVETSFLGQASRETVRIVATGRERDELVGRDLKGNSYRLRRIA